MIRNIEHSLCKYILPLLLLCSVSLPVHAGGIFLYEISSADTRLASAGWSARAQDPSTVFTNPAGMTRLCGKQVELGAQAIFTRVRFEPNDDTTVGGHDGDADKWLPSGSMFYVHPFNDCLTFGVGTLGYFGADLVYNHDWVGRYYVQKVLLEGFSFVPAVAYKINDQWSIGVGANVMYGIFKQRSALRSLLAQMSDGYFTCHAYRFGCGGLVGILYEPTPCTRLGIQYLSPVKLNFHGKPKFNSVDPLVENILTFIGVTGSSLNLDVEVPQSVMFSAYHELNARWAFMANVGWQQWSRFQEATIVLNDLEQDEFRVQKKYRDSWHTAVGVEWRWSCDLTLSAGVAYDSSVVSDRERTPSFPVGDQWRFGTGARWNFSDHLVVDLSAELQWQGNLDLDVNKGLLVGRVAGTYKDTYAVFMNANLTYLF